MGLLSSVLLFPIAGPIHGLTFVLEQIRDQAEAELNEEARLRNELILLHMRRESGEITEQEFITLHTRLIERLNAIRSAMEAADGGVSADEQPGG